MGKRVRLSSMWALPELVGKKMRSRGEDFVCTGVSLDGRIVYGINPDGEEDEYYTESGTVTVGSDDDDANLCPWLFE